MNYCDVKRLKEKLDEGRFYEIQEDFQKNNFDVGETCSNAREYINKLESELEKRNHFVKVLQEYIESRENYILSLEKCIKDEHETKTRLFDGGIDLFNGKSNI